MLLEYFGQLKNLKRQFSAKASFSLLLILPEYDFKLVFLESKITIMLQEYASDLWNVVDFVTNSLYVATIGLRIRAFCDVS